MATTTTIWAQNSETQIPTEEQRIALNTMATSLSGGNNLLINYDPSGAKIATREWPTTEIAQVWTDYILANYDVVSSVIDPE
jgi:hypothetical protein